MKNPMEKIKFFFDWLSIKLALDIRYLVSNGNWVSLRFFVSSLSGFLLSFFFAKLGSRELLGQYQLVISILSMASVCSFLGLNAAALEAVVQGRDAGVFKASKLIFLFSLLGVPIIMCIGVFYIALRQEIVLGEALIFSGFLFPLFYALSTWNVYYEGKALFKESSIRIIMLSIVLTIFLIVSIVLKLNLLWLVAMFLIVNISLQSVFFLELFQKIKDRGNSFIDIKFGIVVSFQKFTSGLSSNIPPLAISFLFGVELLAVYYIAYYVIGAIASFFSNLIALYVPTLFKKIKLNHKSILLNNLFAGVLAWIIFVIFLRFFFMGIYGEGYRDSLKLAYGISFLLLFIPLHTYLVSFLSVRKKNSFLVAVFCIANVIGLAVIYPIKHLGFFWGVTAYLYALELVTIIPLAVYYIVYANEISS